MLYSVCRLDAGINRRDSFFQNDQEVVVPLRFTVWVWSSLLSSEHTRHCAGTGGSRRGTGGARSSSDYSPRLRAAAESEMKRGAELWSLGQHVVAEQALTFSSLVVRIQPPITELK
jgi:hypothetical protein